MLKTEIKLNESNIIKSSQYTAEVLYNAIDKVFGELGFNKMVLKDGTLCYSGSGRPSDYAAFGNVITSLKSQPWFIDNVEKWLWYNSDNGENENDFSVEDILYHYTKRESVA